MFSCCFKTHPRCESEKPEAANDVPRNEGPGHVAAGEPVVTSETALPPANGEASIVRWEDVQAACTGVAAVEASSWSERIVASLDAIEAGLPCGQASLLVLGPHAAGTSGGMVGADVASGPLGGGWVFCSTSGAATAMHPLCAPHHAAWMTSLRDSLQFCKQEASAMTAVPNVSGAYLAAGAAAAPQRAVVVACRLMDVQQHSNLMLGPAAAAVSAAVAAAATPVVTVRPLPISLGPGELLALPVFHMRGGWERLTAVLLLGGLHGTLDAGEAVAAAVELQQQPAAQRAQPQHQGAVPEPQLQHRQQKLGLPEYRELQRLAQFVGFGLFADPSHTAFLSKVAAQLAAVAGSHGLHDAIVAVLDTVPELIRFRTSVIGRPLLAACTAPLPQQPTPSSQQHPQPGAGGGTGTGMVGSAAQGASAAQQNELLSTATAADVARMPAAAVGGAPATDGGLPSAGAASVSGAGSTNPVVVFAHRSGAAAAAHQDGNHPAAAASAGVIGGSAGANANASPFHSVSASNLPAVNQNLFARLPNSPLGGGGGGGPDSGALSRVQRVHSVNSMRCDGDGGTSSGVGGLAAAKAPEPSRIKAVRMQLPRSLLYKAIKASGSQYQPQQPSPSAAPAGSHGSGIVSLRQPGVPVTSLSSGMLGQQMPTQQQQQQLHAGSRRRTGTSNVGAAAAGGIISSHPSTVAAAAAAFGPSQAGPFAASMSALALATGRGPISTLTLSDASAHVLEDNHALRDVLLAGNLLGGVSPGAVVVCVEGPPLPPGILFNSALAASGLAAGASGAVGASAGTATIGTSGAGLQSHTGTLSSTGGGYVSTTASALLTTHSVPAGAHAAGSMLSPANNPPVTGASSSGAAGGGVLGRPPGTGDDDYYVAVVAAPDATSQGRAQSRPSMLSMLATAASYAVGGSYPGAAGTGVGAGQGASSLAPASARVLSPSAFSTANNFSLAPPGVLAGLPVVTAPAPGRLALYLVFAETLPAGVLQMVESELKQLMPMVFACFRAVLSGGNFSPVPTMPYGTPLVTLAQPPYSRVPADWRLLYEQVTGRTVPLPSLATTFSGAGAGGAGLLPVAAGGTTAGGGTGGAVLSRMISGLETVSEIESQLLEKQQQQQYPGGFGSVMSLGTAAPGAHGQLAAAAAASMGAPAASSAGGAAGGVGGAAAAALYGSDNARSTLTPPLSPVAGLGGSASVGARRPLVPSATALGASGDPAGSAGGGGVGCASAGGIGSSSLLSSPRGTMRQQAPGAKSHGGPLSLGDGSSASGGGGGPASLAAALKRRLTERSVSGGAVKALLGLGLGGHAGAHGRISGVVSAAASGGGGGTLQLPGVGGGGGIAGFVSGLNAYGVGGGVGLFGVGQMDTAPVDTVLEISKAGSANAHNWLYNSSPEVQLEEALQAAAAAAVTASGGVPRTASMAAQQQQQSTELLVSTVRSRLTAALAGSEDTEQARAALHQDLEAIELLDVLGRGGQGVVFRGTMHGLEAAIKVFAQNQAMAANQAEQDKQAAALKAKEREKQKARDVNDPLADSSEGEAHTAGGEAAEGLVRQAKRGAMEVAVSQSISHPNIVQVYAAFSGVVVVRCQYRDSPLPVLRLCTPDDSMLGNSDPGPLNQVLCLEYCDAGTLLAASRSGAFRLPCATGPANGAIWPALVPLYTSLLEVALALRHLHSRRLVHCDVKAANVLLKSSTRDPRGWTCKLSDFGCVRLMNDAGPDGALGFRVTHPLGTVGHMAPECFVKGALLGAAVDVYALGIMMYEMLMCRTPYSNMNPQDVPRQVLRSGVRPVFHPLAPATYVSLAARCWSASPRRRPTASELVTALQGLLADAQAAAADATAGGSAGAAGRGAAAGPARAQPAAPAVPAAAPVQGRVAAPALAAAGAGAAGQAAAGAAAQQSKAAPAAAHVGPMPGTTPEAARGKMAQLPLAPPAVLPETVSVKRLEEQQRQQVGPLP
ncbi:hypothetical protein HXX76_005675 [Chlamydomonas incerta]|uniref:Protein kinase domain-containing protein n=1 Tax=Chlamydomonas incerta TaxID=51695 RepID=A0A835TI00_CHLIN|nr:hypothetical protein HXX76_005675 [Chlamydomonas incerta]|eukprot:KAG2438065.1 hypothetical protein HXX76_005675 [Chlamydomonas incerta]